MNEVAVVFLILAAIAAVHAGTFAAEARWHTKRSYVLRHGEGETLLERLQDGLARNSTMLAQPPWYVRYNRWVTRKGRR